MKQKRETRNSAPLLMDQAPVDARTSSDFGQSLTSFGHRYVADPLPATDLERMAAKLHPLNGAYDFSARGVGDAPPSPGIYAVFRRSGGVLYIGESENMQQELTERFRDQSEQPTLGACDDLCFFCQSVAERARRQRRAKELIRLWRPPGNR